LGIWSHWKDEGEENNGPFSDAAVNQMKAFLRRNAPASYSDIFVEETTDDGR
jgi:hypothetical protein